MKEEELPVDAAQEARKVLDELRATLGSIGDGVIATDGAGQITRLNPVAASLTRWSEAEALGKRLDEVFRIVHEKSGVAIENPAAPVLHEKKTMALANDTLLIARDGTVCPITGCTAPICDEEGAINGAVLVFHDQTAARAAQQALRKSEELHRFQENLDRVDRAIKQETDVEQMLWNIVQAVFSIFDCDRAWLFYPCDPEAPSFRVPVEVSRSEYPGANIQNMDVPMSPDLARNLRELLESDGPVTYTVGTDRPVNQVTAEQFGVQSQMAVALYPKVGKPWVFGLHQCSYPRRWTREEKKLFSEIGRRVSDGLSSVLFLRDLQENEERFRATFEQAAVGLAHVAPNGRWLRVNQKLCAIVGYSREELLQKTFQDITYPEDLETDLENGRQLLAGKIPTYRRQKRYIRKDGSLIWINLTVSIVRDASGSPAYFIAVIEDISERQRAEMALEESEAKTRSILDNIGIGVTLISRRMEILEMNRRMREWFPAIDVGKSPICYRAFNDPPREEACGYCPTVKTLQDGLVHEATTQTPQDGVIRNYRIVSSPVFNAAGEVTAAIEMVEDITEKLSLESQLRQAQKMEAVGRLAGGVAHDFNNMLGVILGHAELALEQVDPVQPLHDDLTEIRKAGQRAAELTRQLLAFARKQTVSPKVLDLNETVASMLSMLHRLIGEDINLTWLPGGELWPVKIDPVQVDQILANLCVNARDACAGVGRITLETNKVTFDEVYCTLHEGFSSGEYVQLAVSDSGYGMDKEVLENLFEPFFTTKDLGQGTGLGLSTVYGIVKQNQGFINVYSEPGVGTTFRIYLPRYRGTREQEAAEGRSPQIAGGPETILLVEDEPAILNLGRAMLERLGYRVLTAGTPGQALAMAKEYAGDIDLVVTDVVMPEMNGRALCQRLLLLYPHLKRLFMSGYTANIIAHHGVLEEGVFFVQKPFSLRELSVKVQEALGKKE
ncbi:MAG: PAS domain S-box protein [Deltaproteobacteria bacterium]|nr:PAS domain S-box protein [Deltaproteobacteria bacterium]